LLDAMLFRVAGWNGRTLQVSIETWGARPTDIQICKSAVNIGERLPTLRDRSATNECI
jgi:hypothetical protein